MKKIYILLSIIIYSSNILYASVIDDFLLVKNNSNDTDKVMQKFQFESSYIEKARVNVEQSHFSHPERDYALRLYTKSSQEIENEERLFNLNKEIYKEKNNLEKIDTLKNRYKILVETAYQSRLLHMLLDEMNFKQNTLDVRKNSLEKESDVINLYEIKKSINNTELQQLRYQQKHQRLLYKIGRVLGIEDLSLIRKEINQNIFSNPTKIINYISQDIKENNQLSSNLFSKNDNYKLELAKERTKTEKIKDQIKLDNIEVKFDDSKKMKNSLSVGLSIEIPISKNSADIAKEQLKLLSLKNKIDRNSNELKDKIIELKEDILFLIKYFNKTSTQISNINLDDGQGTYPIKFILNIRKQNLKFEKEKAKTLYQITDKYINLLYLTNRLENSNFKDILKNRESY